MDRIVGYGFRPTDEEMINYFLKNKILGKNSLVDNAISEVNIYAFDPWDLCFQSKIDSSYDSLWYFFFRPEKMKMLSRKTRSGFWKKTGVTMDIKPRRGNHGKIGEKKVLVFHTGRTPNGVRTEWVMHEYHTSSFLPDQRTHIICRIEFKGEGLKIRNVNAIEPSHSSISNLNKVGDGSLMYEVDQPVHGNSGSDNWQAGLSLEELQSQNQFGVNLDTQQQIPFWDEDEMQRFLDSLKEERWDFMRDDQDIGPYTIMQQNRNDFRPQKSMTGTCSDGSSDSDDASSSSVTSHGQTSSWVIGNAGSSNERYQAQGNNNLRSRPEHTKGESQGDPRRMQLQGKYQREEEVRNVTSDKEKLEMAQDRSKKTSPSACFVSEQQKQQKSAPHSILPRRRVWSNPFVRLSCSCCATKPKIKK